MAIDTPDWMEPHVEVAAMLSAAICLENAAAALERVQDHAQVDISHSILYYRTESQRIVRNAVDRLKESYSTCVPPESEVTDDLAELPAEHGDNAISEISD